MARHKWARSDKYPEAMTAVYRLFDAAGRLLYVGIGENYIARWKSHMKKAWWQDVARKEVIWHPSRLEAAWDESTAIDTEDPVHNRYPGIDRISVVIFRMRVGWQRLWVCPIRPQMTTSKWERDAALDEVMSNRAHALVMDAGEPISAVVPWEWYKVACEAMGVPGCVEIEEQLETEERARRAAIVVRRKANMAAKLG